jgi:LPS-assembly lipoprotein
MLTNNLIKLTLASGLLCALPVISGCGFHLRGQGILPDSLKQIVLKCRPADAQNLCNEIRSQLATEDIIITESDTQEDPVNTATNLVISSVKDRRRAASLAQDASAAEIEFSRSIDFEFYSRSLGVKAKTMTATQFQTYQYTELSVLGKEKEEQQVKGNLDQMLATEIINRLASTLTLSANHSD